MYLEEIIEIQGYENLLPHLKANPQPWLDFFNNQSPMPTGWESPMAEDSEINALIREAVIVRLIKPDQTDISARKIIEKIFP